MIFYEKLDKDFNSYKSNDFICFKCDYCGVEFLRKKKSFEKSRKFIDKDCCLKKDCITKKRKESCLLKYGCECSLQSEDSKLKTKQTCLKKYNCEHIRNVQCIYDKIYIQ